MNLIFLGAPGVGKGTIAKMLAKSRGLIQISTGDLLRAAVKEGTELGNKAKSYMDSGELVPDELVINLLKERISKPDCGAGYILDGFPRTIPQAEALDKSEVNIEKVVDFTVRNEIIIKRLSSRRVCRKCGEIFNLITMPPRKEGICDKCDGELYQRDDDKEEAIRNRLAVYEKQTMPLVEFYRKKGLLVEVDGEPGREEVLADVEKVI